MAIRMKGIFDISMLKRMRRELRRGDNSTETEAEREERAVEIIQRNAAQSVNDIETPQAS